MGAGSQAGRAAGVVLQHGAWRRVDSGAASHLKHTHTETNALSHNQLNVTSHTMNESLCSASQGPALRLGSCPTVEGDSR